MKAVVIMWWFMDWIRVHYTWKSSCTDGCCAEFEYEKKCQELFFCRNIDSLAAYGNIMQSSLVKPVILSSDFFLQSYAVKGKFFTSSLKVNYAVCISIEGGRGVLRIRSKCSTFSYSWSIDTLYIQLIHWLKHTYVGLFDAATFPRSYSLVKATFTHKFWWVLFFLTIFSHCLKKNIHYWLAEWEAACLDFSTQDVQNCLACTIKMKKNNKRK